MKPKDMEWKTNDVYKLSISHFVSETDVDTYSDSGKAIIITPCLMKGPCVCVTAV